MVEEQSKESMLQALEGASSGEDPKANARKLVHILGDALRNNSFTRSYEGAVVIVVHDKYGVHTGGTIGPSEQAPYMLSESFKAMYELLNGSSVDEEEA